MSPCVVCLITTCRPLPCFLALDFAQTAGPRTRACRWGDVQSVRVHVLRRYKKRVPYSGGGGAVGGGGAAEVCVAVDEVLAWSCPQANGLYHEVG